MFDLELPELTPQLSRAIEHAVADAGAWPVRFTPGREERRWYGVRKSFPDVLEVLTSDARGHVLMDPEHWDEHAWEFRPDAVERIARLIEVLGDHAPGPFVFRATWAGSPIERRARLSVEALADLVRSGELNDHTAYVVSPAS